MPSYPHIEKYHADLERFIEFGGSDNEQSIRRAFAECLDSYCREHRERLALVDELSVSASNRPDGTVKDSLRMARGYWEAKDSHDDLDAEIKVKFNRGYPRDNIIFEDSQTAVLVQNGNEAMRVDMSRVGELHRLIRVFLDYELPEIQEFRQAQGQFKTDLPTVLENLRATVAEAEADNPDYQQAALSFLELCRKTIGPAVSCWLPKPKSWTGNTLIEVLHAKPRTRWMATRRSRRLEQAASGDHCYTRPVALERP